VKLEYATGSTVPLHDFGAQTTGSGAAVLAVTTSKEYTVLCNSATSGTTAQHSSM
jgi:hypothetical protein